MQAGPSVSGAAAALAAGISDDTAFNAPVLEVDFSVCVAPMVRR